MSQNIVVVGGGFVGQLVQLAVPSARVIDWRKEKPKNHLDSRVGPQYLWEPIEGVPSKSFDVFTLVDGMAPTDDAILAYKRKIGKENDGGDWGLQFQHKTTGWDSELPEPRVEYNQQVKMVDLLGHALGMADWTTIGYDLLVSTIPMPSFLELMIVGPTYRDQFKSDPIYMSKETIITDPEHDLEKYQLTLDYCSLLEDPCYRTTSAQVGRVKVEFKESLSPMPNSKRILPGKIHPHRENETIIAALQTYDCFCFGRFATWRPDELAHQTWKEILEWKERLGL